MLGVINLAETNKVGLINTRWAIKHHSQLSDLGRKECASHLTPLQIPHVHSPLLSGGKTLQFIMLIAKKIDERNMLTGAA